MSRKGAVLVTTLLLAAAVGPAGSAGAARGAPVTAPGTAPVAEQGNGPGTRPVAVAESSSGGYVVVMKQDPVVAATGTEGVRTADARATSEALVEAQDTALAEAGLGDVEKINTYTVALNGFSARLSREEASRLAARKDVSMVVPDELRQLQTDASPQFLGLSGTGGAWSTGVTGEGVVVGVIDSGIWPEHPSFADSGDYPEPPAPSDALPCEFGNLDHNRLDAPFRCTNKLIGARQTLNTYRTILGAEPEEFDSARDDDGHGTHTASTAAGNGGVTATLYGQDRGEISGIAPRAHVVAYKALGPGGGFTSDLVAAIDRAVLDGVDVINYSVGGGPGLTQPDEIAYLLAADAGVFVATSAGNDGPGEETVGGPASVPWLTAVGANTQERFFEGRVVLGDGTEITGASITPGVGSAPLVDGAAAGDELCAPDSLDPLLVDGAIVLCARGVVGRVEKGLAVHEAGGVGMVMYEQTDQGNLFSDSHFVPTVHVDNTPGLAIKAYIAAAEAPTASIVAGTTSTWPYAPSMTSFSSRGPNVPVADIIKPDITAPGLQILAGFSPHPAPGTYPSELFAAIAGTSMSSPHVAGVFALIKQTHPDWSPAMAKSAIMTTADQDVLSSDRVTRATPFEMGSGHLDPGRTTRHGSAFQPGLVYDARFNDYLGFLCDADPTIFVNAEATCAALEELGVPTDTVSLNYPSIGVSQVVGEQTVTRTVTSVAEGTRRYRVSVEAPEGYDVEVSPSSFRISEGESVTYTVTIRNDSGAADEWAFGSLTWSSGGYDVYSPIAVKGQPLSAPDEVTDTGVDGSTEFDVHFGYAGAYEAAAHGLEPATVTQDVVPQDPDQVFDPEDGFSDAHPVTVSGAAHLRVAIPPEAAEAQADLDVFLADPSGEVVAASTSGGTDEQIDVPAPADGTWTVYVQGWTAPGGDSPYTLSTWVVSATPGGNLVVDEAPTEAVLGEVGNVAVSWSGATAGQWHLGAVSHTGPDGVLDLTLVEVDNR